MCVYAIFCCFFCFYCCVSSMIGVRLDLFEYRSAFSYCDPFFFFFCSLISFLLNIWYLDALCTYCLLAWIIIHISFEFRWNAQKSVNATLHWMWQTETAMNDRRARKLSKKLLNVCYRHMIKCMHAFIFVTKCFKTRQTANEWEWERHRVCHLIEKKTQNDKRVSGWGAPMPRNITCVRVYAFLMHLPKVINFYRLHSIRIRFSF